MGPRIHRKPKSRQWQWDRPSSIAIAGILATAAIVAPARAAILNNWSFDPDTRQFTVTLPEGVTPDYFLLAQPARIVLDLPETALGDIPLAQEYSGAIRSIRLSEIQGGSRVVIELAPNTLLDPRHAELTSSGADNGRTLWTLQPLIQDGESIAPIATATPQPQSSEAPDVSPVAATPPESAVTSSAPSETIPELASTEAEPATEEAVPQLEPSELSSDEEDIDSASSEPEVVEPSEAISVTPPSADAPDTESAELETTQQIPPSLPVIEGSGTDSSGASTAEPSPLPDIAHSATTGAAQALPSGPDPLRGARTDAAALEGVGAEAVSEFPPNQLPSDSVTSATQPIVSVPPLSDRVSPHTPQVSVPPLADVQEASSIPDTAATTSPGTPSPEAAVTIPVPSVPTSESEAAAIAAPDAASPSLPSAPTTASEPASSGIPPEAIRPPQAEVTASVPPPPIAEPSSQEPVSAVPSNAAPVVAPSHVTAAETAALPPPPAIDAAVETLPPETAPDVANTVPVPANPPPFLSSHGDTNSPEQPPIPPPPSSSSQNERIVPFGAPLPPQEKAIEGPSTPASFQNLGTIPAGTQLVLQYPGNETLTLNQQEPWYEVLIVAEDAYHPNTNERLLAKGTQVIGRFEGFNDSGHRFVGQVFVEENGDRRSLLAESDWFEGTPQPTQNNILTNSGIGAAALTILSGFSGIGLIGGAALGAASSFATAPRIVTIEPGQLITVEVVSEGEPFNEAASAP